MGGYPTDTVPMTGEQSNGSHNSKPAPSKSSYCRPAKGGEGPSSGKPLPHNSFGLAMEVLTASG